MLSKVLELNGIGLLHQVRGGASLPFKQVTLLYAENGRGKSTLATVLRSCAEQNSDLIEDRVTVDADTQPVARILFESEPANYENGTWTGRKPEIIVYDEDFITSNVYAGNEITSSQRANLLDFAIGATAVTLRRRQDEATRRVKAENERLRELHREAESLIGDAMPIAEFRALDEEPEIDELIVQAQRRLDALTRSSQINSLPSPRSQQIPDFDLEKVFEALNTTLDTVHVRATAAVTEHLSHLRDANSADWIRRGLDIANNDTCPFCGQNVSDLELLEMYRSYFDDAYSTLEADIRAVLERALQQSDPSQINNYASLRSHNNEILELWREQIPMPSISDERDKLAELSLTAIQEILESLFASKSTSIAEACGTNEQLSELERLWSQFAQIYSDENAIIQSAQQRIAQYKESLDTTSLNDARKQLTRLNLTKMRHERDTVALFKEMSEVETRLTDLETTKQETRTELTSAMSDTLRQFKDSINEHLERSGAAFTIEEIRHNYLGSTPRVDYQIRLRGRTIQLQGGRPTFATALSKGDKKTMGFAFFAASALKDPYLSEKIVVIDDPMSSLDASRREYTTKVVEEIACRAKQVILMAHDEYFLRDIRERLRRRDRTLPVSVASLTAARGGYSDLAELDLDDLCRSTYLRNYELVTAIVNHEKTSLSDIENGAKALRPLLEGYLHRKYPNAVPSGTTLGRAIEAIESAAGSDLPWAPMAQMVGELRELNSYASRFHHDTQPDVAPPQRAVASEVVGFGKRTLEIIHSV